MSVIGECGKKEIKHAEKKRKKGQVDDDAGWYLDYSLHLIRAKLASVEKIPRNSRLSLSSNNAESRDLGE